MKFKFINMSYLLFVQLLEHELNVDINMQSTANTQEQLEQETENKKLKTRN